MRPTTAVTMVRLEPGSTPASGSSCSTVSSCYRPVLGLEEPAPAGREPNTSSGLWGLPPWIDSPRRSKGPDCSPSRVAPTPSPSPSARHSTSAGIRALKRARGFCSARTYLLVMGLGPHAVDLASGVQQVQWVPRRPKLGFCQGFTSVL